MAQLVARLVRNEKVRGSNPLSSTTSGPGRCRISRAELFSCPGLRSAPQLPDPAPIGAPDPAPHDATNL